MHGGRQCIARFESAHQELTYFLQLYDRLHVGGTALSHARSGIGDVELYLLQLRQHDRIGNDALELALRVLRPRMDVEKIPYKPKDEVKCTPTFDVFPVSEL